MENNFSSYLGSSKSVLIVLPKKPYFDQVAAGLSLYLSLVDKKEVNIICPNPMLVEFNRLVGVDKVTQEVPNKNLIIKIEGYKADDIERVSSEVKNGELYLIVIPQSGVKPPKKEQVVISDSGISSDLVILVGGADVSHFPILSEGKVSGLSVFHIGTRPLAGAENMDIISLVKQSSSVSEIVADLIKEMQLEVDADIASNLISGIEIGSNHYTTDGVSANTFQLIADLMRLGGQRFPQLPKKDYPQGAIPTVKPFSQQEQVEISKAQSQSQEENPPQDWLAPKIFKSTQIS